MSSAEQAIPIQSGRTETERRVLSAVQAAGALASAEIARRTGLSAQSASVLTRTLEAEGLLMRGDPMRGKVGKPQVPISLNPAGAFAFGLKIGRRRADLVLMRGDPTADPGAFRNTVLVFKDGVGYDSAKLFDSVKGWVGVR